MADRIRCIDKRWYDMLKPVINKCNNTVHSTIQMKPVRAHKDDNSLEVKQNIELKASYTTNYPDMSAGDKIENIY